MKTEDRRKNRNNPTRDNGILKTENDCSGLGSVLTIVGKNANRGGTKKTQGSRFKVALSPPGTGRQGREKQCKGNNCLGKGEA